MANTKKDHSFIYIILLFLFIVLVGGTIILLYIKKLNAKPSTSNDVLPSVTKAENKFIPEEIDCQTTLFALVDGDNDNNKLFMLTRFLPTKDKLYIVPVPDELLCRINTDKKTLSEFYRTGGITESVKACENTFDISIEKYMVMNDDSFSNFANIFGGVNVTIPYDLIYRSDNSDESIVIRKGEQYLDSTRLRQLLTFPSFREGNDMRYKLMGITISDLINKNLSERLTYSMDSSFNSLVNVTNTNINAHDYNERKEALCYMVTDVENPTEYLICNGEYNENNQFEITDLSKQSIKEKFALN